jgi:hypothetical protein
MITIMSAMPYYAEATKKQYYLPAPHAARHIH